MLPQLGTGRHCQCVKPFDPIPVSGATLAVAILRYAEESDMSVVSLRAISEHGDNFEFRFVTKDHPIAINFTEENGTILLHLSVRATDNIIVLNDLIGGKWGTEVRIPTEIPENLPCHVDVLVVKSSLTIKFDGSSIFDGMWRNDISMASALQLGEQDIHVKRTSIGADLTNQAAAVGVIDRDSVRLLLSKMEENIISAIEKKSDETLSFYRDKISFYEDKQAINQINETKIDPLHFSFDDKSLKIHKDCNRKGGYIVSQMDGSTPGLRLHLDRPMKLSGLSLSDVEGQSKAIGLLLTDEAGKLIEEHTAGLTTVATKHKFNIRSHDEVSRIHIVLKQPKKGDTFRFKDLSVEPLQIIKSPSLRRTERRVAGVASMPSRVKGLEQAIDNLGNQVDELHVYLNGYRETPSFLLNNPRICVYDSVEYDDRGDAGKFFAYNRSQDAYFLSFDDDIIYPGDYADKLVEVSRRYSAPCGVHGSILRLPEPKYYDLSNRYVFHFRDKNLFERRVHVLGTGTFCAPPGLFDSRLKLNFRNMADIWVARKCAEAGVPQICVKREFNWLKPFGTDEGSIFQSNLEKTTQSLIVEAEVAKFAKFLPEIKSKQKKVVIGIKTYNRLPYLQECIASLVRTTSPNFESVIVVADDGSTDGTEQYLKELKLPFETYVINNKRSYVTGQFNSILDKARDVKADFIFVIDDDVVFKKEGWMQSYYDAAISSGYHHLCHFNLPHYEQLCVRRGESFPPAAMEHSEYKLSAYGSVERCMGALFTLTPKVVDDVGFADEVNFFVRGLWHIDYSARCCRAGFNEYNRFFDIKNSNDYIELQNTLKETYSTSIPWESDDFKRASLPIERERRWKIVRQPSRVQVSRQDAIGGKLLIEPPASHFLHTVNSVFDRVFVINLDRRADRMALMHQRLQNLAIDYRRVSAFDGHSPEIQSHWQKYSASRTPDINRRVSSRDFVLSYKAESDRVHHLEAVLNGPAIRTPGAWAYAKTYQMILRECLSAGYERVLVFDDDGLFHKDFNRLFSDAVSQLPLDWKILQLGTMQYDWDWTRPYSENLYMPDGVIVGSHAVGFHADTISLFLEYIERWSLPFDVGALHYVSREYKEKSFVIKPNLVIQDQSESDINSSDVAESEGMKSNNIYGWNLEDYLR